MKIRRNAFRRSKIPQKQFFHQQNLKLLAKEIYKFVNGLSPPIMSDLFTIHENPNNLKNFQALYLPNKRNVKLGIHGFRDSVPVRKMHACH